MDYEKKYNDALERARQIKDGKDEWRYSDLAEITPALTEIFPELSDSEDERIRKVLLNLVSNDKVAGYTNFYEERGITCDDAIAYLEKQKEPTPAEWSNADMKEARNNLISVCRDWERGEQTTLLPIVAVRARYFLEHLTEPKPVEWSEEDEAMLDSVIRIITRFDDLAHEPTFAGPKWTHPYTKELNFLEKLRNRF